MNKKETIEEKLIEDITQLFGNKTKLKIVCLDNISLEKSGKRKYIISNIKE